MNLKIPKLRPDFLNTRQLLKEFEEALKDVTDEKDKYDILMNYITTYEEFIDSFDKNNFDNETLYEKYYIYLKELFEKYIIILNIKEKDNSSVENENHIKENIKNYINIFTLKISGYLYDLLNILEKSPKKIFYEIVVYAMEKMNISGKSCLEERKPFCKYNCLMFFETSFSLFSKYINNISRLAAYINTKDKCREELEICLLYINEVKNGSILLLEDSIKQGKLIKSGNTGFTHTLNGFIFSKDEEEEKNEIILQNYEKVLREINPDIDNTLCRRIFSKKLNINEAICIANIVKISYSFLGKTSRRLLDLCENCEFIAQKLEISEEQEWYKEFIGIYKELKENYEIIESLQKDMRIKIREKYRENFEELENKFNKKKNNEEFIYYVLDIYHFKGYENPQNQNKIKTLKDKDEQELLQFLRSKYHPDQYKYSLEDEKTQLNYCII